MSSPRRRSRRARLSGDCDPAHAGDPLARRSFAQGAQRAREAAIEVICASYHLRRRLPCSPEIAASSSLALAGSTHAAGVCKALHMSWYREGGPRGYHHGNLKEALSARRWN